VSVTKKTKKVGRPPLPKRHAKGQMIRMRINDADLKLPGAKNCDQPEAERCHRIFG
jgi:hypothetical protein